MAPIALGNGSEWHWKDEDELAWAVEQGRCDRDRAIEIRRDGERARELIARREPPFDEEWERWRPDPAWGIAQLPERWKAEPIVR
ncbi:MAG: hypothetical protein KGN00_06060 [Chloroflexota bacterium]|nr:hypothetical protein [Chloroflexota bacterium]